MYLFINFLKQQINNYFLLTIILIAFSSPFAQAGGGGGGGGGGLPNPTAVTCNVPFQFNLDNGFVGCDPTTAAGSCGQCCFAGSDLDCDGEQDVSFSVENSEWFEWCNPTGAPLTVTVGFDEPGGGGLCNIQGAVWVGTPPLDATILDCNNPEFDEFGSNPGGGADGFTFTVTVGVGECAFFMVDGYAGSTCNGVEAVVPCPAALPVSLVSFEGEVDAKNLVQLQWTTRTEINNDYFTIEKSKDGKTFEVVGIIDGAGNTSNVMNYHLEDAHPYSGTSYYRLKQTDYDDNYFYSELVSIKINSVFEDLFVYPNPVEGLGYLSLHSGFNTNTTIAIHDVSGRVVESETHNISKGNNTITLNTNNFTQGMYFLSLKNGNKNTTIKFIKN